VVGLAGCADDAIGDGPTEVTWVMNPAEEEIDIQVQYAPLFEYVESEVDVEIVGQPTASYSGTVQELRRAEGGGPGSRGHLPGCGRTDRR